ncbi:hypothetical protein NK6_9719 [Bradyrhizobium diazoefficiens]|uniref:Uncharacterized protein n=1 Tax=Bradyrhizobium diazoefficiens TaxID=1355477 RepID=A0A0E3VXL2_9BRAD|nr:hypothetical protein NK6_9719 [Bradyrhizobium diazoefficiens]
MPALANIRGLMTNWNVTHAARRIVQSSFKRW